ncbi:MAG: hypothetical protein ACOCVF_01255 [bacterium]
MKTPEKIFDDAIKAKGLDIVSVKDADLYEAGLDAIKEALNMGDVINRLQKLRRFNLVNYRNGEYAIDTEREYDDNGDYIDTYDIDVLIENLSKVH